LTIVWLPNRASAVAGLLVAALFFQRGMAEELEMKVKVNIAALDLASVARQAERITKRSFLFDETVLRAKKVTLQSDTPISAVEYYRVFQSVCQMNGFLLVPVEDAGIKLEKIVAAQGAFKEPGGQLVMTRGETVPGGDAPVSYLAKLKSASALRVLAALTPALSSTGSAIQIPGTDLILINDVASSVKRAEKIIELIDVPGDAVKTLTVQLKNLSVDKAQAIIADYMQAVAKAKTGEAARDRLAIVKDDRLNVLHLMGAATEVEDAARFAAEIDVDAPEAKRTIKYYKLKNVSVKDIVEHASQLLSAALSAKQSEGQLNSSLLSVPRTPLATFPISPGSSSSTSASAPSTSQPAVVSARSADALKHAPGAPEIIPVEGQNTLVVVGDAAAQREIEGILENLDRRKGQVLIEVAIVQISGDDNVDLGTEFLSLNGQGGTRQADVGTGFGIGAQSDAAKRGFPTQDSLGSLTTSAFRYVGRDQFQVLITSLATKSNVSIVSQPLLLVNDNEEASFTTKVSEPTVTTSQGTATTNTAFSGFADATTSLKITPHLSPGGFMGLEIVQTVEEFTGVSAGAGIPPPKVSNNATTKITVPDRQTIVIGGFTRDSSTDSKSGIPGLMKIPGVGNLFSKTSKKKSVSRLYLFVHPRILSTDDFEDLKCASSLKKDDAERVAGKSKIKPEIKERIGRGPNVDNAEIIPFEPVPSKP
jgi:general secretion pathway protein D